MMNKAQYQRYLNSPHWRQRREKRVLVAGGRCEFRPDSGNWDRKYGTLYGDRCNRDTNLEVHHRHYDSIGAEKDEDLEVLCRFHHLVREAVGSLDCPECGDPMQYEEEDIVFQVKEAILEAGGINRVTVQEIRDRCSWVINCSYCCR